MIAAERLLLASALEDQSNQRFVLLSDRCASLSITHRVLLMPDHTLLHLTLAHICDYANILSFFTLLLLSVLQMCSVI